MAINQTGIAISIKGFLPTGKTLDEQFNALSMVRDAHATGDYSALLAAAQDVEVKTEQKTRRIEEKTDEAANDPNPEHDPTIRFGEISEALTPEQIAAAEAGPTDPEPAETGETAPEVQSPETQDIPDDWQAAVGDKPAEAAPRKSRAAK